MLDKIVMERDSFKTSPTSQKSWLLDRLNKALSWYNGWRQGLLLKPRCAGAVAWAAVSVADLITLVTRGPHSYRRSGVQFADSRAAEHAESPQRH